MRRERIYTFDGLRGVAALVVLLFHSSPGFPAQRDLLQFGYLAVQFFFVLSGFVVANAYAPSFARGMTTARFAELRIIRLYPLYALGCIIGVASAVYVAICVHGFWPLKPLVRIFPFAALMIPNFTRPPLYLFEINPPAWSLFYEVVLNLAYGMFFRYLTTRAMVWVFVIMNLLSVLVFAHSFSETEQLEFGFLLAAPTLCSGYLAGTLMHRLNLHGSRTIRLPKVWAYAMLLSLFFVFPKMGGWAPGFISLVAFPLLVVFVVRCRASYSRSKVEAILGDYSYPLYATHLPTTTFTFAVINAIGFGTVWNYRIALMPILVVAWFAGRYFDPWARGWLTRLAAVRRRDVVAAVPL